MYVESSTAGGVLFVIGKAGRGESGAVVDGPGAQAAEALAAIERVLRANGRDRSHIVRLRIYVVDMARWPLILETVRAFFADRIPPCTTVGVTGLAEPTMVVEIDAEASAEDWVQRQQQVAHEMDAVLGP